MSVSHYDWLKEYQEMDHDCKYLEWSIQKSENEYKRWQIGGDLSNIKLSPESHAAHLEDDIKQMKSELEWRRDAMAELLRLVKSFEGIDEVILRKKYIEGMTLEEIADDQDVHYALSYIRKKHAELRRRIEWLDRWDETKYEDLANQPELLV